MRTVESLSTGKQGKTGILGNLEMPAKNIWSLLEKEKLQVSLIIIS